MNERAVSGRKSTNEQGDERKVLFSQQRGGNSGQGRVNWGGEGDKKPRI